MQVQCLHHRTRAFYCGRQATRDTSLWASIMNVKANFPVPTLISPLVWKKDDGKPSLHLPERKLDHVCSSKLTKWNKCTGEQRAKLHRRFTAMNTLAWDWLFLLNCLWVQPIPPPPPPVPIKQTTWIIIEGLNKWKDTSCRLTDCVCTAASITPRFHNCYGFLINLKVTSRSVPPLSTAASNTLHAM